MYMYMYIYIHIRTCTIYTLVDAWDVKMCVPFIAAVIKHWQGIGDDEH